MIVLFCAVLPFLKNSSTNENRKICRQKSCKATTISTEEISLRVYDERGVVLCRIPVFQKSTCMVCC